MVYLLLVMFLVIIKEVFMNITKCLLGLTTVVFAAGFLTQSASATVTISEIIGMAQSIGFKKGAVYAISALSGLYALVNIPSGLKNIISKEEEDGWIWNDENKVRPRTKLFGSAILAAAAGYIAYAKL